MAINGRGYDWEDISVTLPQGEAVGITEIKYEDQQEITARYGKGGIARSWGRGNYEASGSMVLDRDEWEKLKSALTDGTTGGIYDHTPFTIVVSYANSDMGTVTDTLKNCRITKFSGGGASQGDDNASPVSCDSTILSPIIWNGVAAKAESATI